MRFLLLFVSIGLECGGGNLPPDEPTGRFAVSLVHDTYAFDLAKADSSVLFIEGDVCDDPQVSLGRALLPKPHPVSSGGVLIPGGKVFVDTFLAATGAKVPPCGDEVPLKLKVHCSTTDDEVDVRVLLGGLVAPETGPVGDDISPLSVAHAVVTGDPGPLEGHLLVDGKAAAAKVVARTDGAREIVWTPKGGFEPGRTYALIAQGGPLGLRMADNRCLDAPRQWTVRVRGADEPPFRIVWERRDAGWWAVWDDLGQASYEVDGGEPTFEHRAFIGTAQRCVRVTAHVTRETTTDLTAEVCP